MIKPNREKVQFHFLLIQILNDLQKLPSFQKLKHL